jgi:hypothetical protein
VRAGATCAKVGLPGAHMGWSLTLKGLILWGVVKRV